MSRRNRPLLIGKRFLILCLGFMLLMPISFLSNGQIAHAKAPAMDKIVVSPTPQQLKVNGRGFPLTPVVGLVVGDQTDPSAITVVEEVLHAHGVKRIVKRYADEKAPNTPIAIVIGGPSENRKSAEVLKALGVEGPQDLKKEGYVLVSGYDNGHKTIVLAGKDADGTFYATQTFRQIIKAHPGRDWVPAVKIRDWPQMGNRSSIEGFYGAQWSHEERLSQMDFYGRNKMNMYVYAPKDDPYHRDKWREPYPDKRVKQLQELLQKAKQNHVQFVFAVSPGKSVCYSGDDDFQALVNKMQTMYDIGVRSFALFYDDISQNLHCTQDKIKFESDPSPTAAAQAYLLNRFNQQFLKKHEGTTRLITVPTEYTGTTSSTYKERLADLVDPDVIFYWTGSAVAPAKITGEQAEKVSKIFKHDLLIWDNYTAHDYNTNQLLLGPLTGRSTDLSKYVLGLTANPMSGQAEASKIPLFTVADYAWNSNAYNPKKSWERSIQSFGGDAADALETFAENTYSSRFIDTESLTLTPLINQFWEVYGSGNDEKATQDLLTEFNNVAQAPEKLRKNLGNKNFLIETEPFLNKLELYGKAGEAAVKMLMAQKENNGDVAWQQRLILKKAFDRAKAIPQEMARGVIKPFLEKAIDMNNHWLGIVSKTKPTTTMGTYKSYTVGNMIDNDPSTFYWSNQAVHIDDAVGVDLGDIYTVKSINLLMGSDEKSKDYIHQGILEYSADGKRWHTLKKGDNEREIRSDDLNVKARYIRYRATARQTQWAQVREFMVLSDKSDQWSDVTSSLPVTTMGTYEGYAPGNMIDNDLSTFYWSNRAAHTNDAVGVDLGDVYTVKSIDLLMGLVNNPKDYIHHGVLEYSKDGDQWQALKRGDDEPEIGASDLNVKARYIRYRTTANQTQWVKVREMQVISDKGFQVSGKPLATDDTSQMAAADGNVASAYKAERSPQEGESLIISLPNKKKVDHIVILQDPQSSIKANVQIKNDNDDWITVGSLSGGYNLVKVGKVTNKIRILWENGSNIPMIYEVIPHK